MTNASITEVREAIALVINSAGLGIRALPVVESQINPPVAVVVPGGGPERGVIHYDSTMANGSHDYVFSIMIAVDPTINRISQTSVDDFISPDGPKSLKTALEADPSLGGVVSFVRATSVTHYGFVKWNGVDYMGATMMLEVTT